MSEYRKAIEKLIRDAVKPLRGTFSAHFARAVGVCCAARISNPLIYKGLARTAAHRMSYCEGSNPSLTTIYRFVFTRIYV